jgi:hypothetical protein
MLTTKQLYVSAGTPSMEKIVVILGFKYVYEPENMNVILFDMDSNSMAAHLT